MANELPGMTLKAIGVVRNEIKERSPAGRDWWAKTISEIVIDSSLTEALDGLEGFSHIIVLYWMHQAAARKEPLKIHPRGRMELPLTGFFATRSPNRPNPIGKATARLIQHHGNVLRVEGLDAIDGTPVIDIKPYIPRYDSVDDAKVPPWITNR